VRDPKAREPPRNTGQGCFSSPRCSWSPTTACSAGLCSG